MRVMFSTRTTCIQVFSSYSSLRASTCESGALRQQLAMNGVKQPDARKAKPLKDFSNLDSTLFIFRKLSVRPF